jgi:hypothetical protein
MGGLLVRVATTTSFLFWGAVTVVLLTRSYVPPAVREKKKKSNNRPRGEGGAKGGSGTADLRRLALLHRSMSLLTWPRLGGKKKYSRENSRNVVAFMAVHYNNKEMMKKIKEACMRPLRGEAERRLLVTGRERRAVVEWRRTRRAKTTKRKTKTKRKERR